MTLRFTVQGETWPAGARRSVDVAESAVTIGRDPSCEWVLADPGVSPRHARIVSSGAGFRLEALSATSPTALNDPLRPLKAGESAPVGPGDLIYVHAYKIRVEAVAAPAVEPVAPPRIAAGPSGMGRFSGRVSDLMGSGEEGASVMGSARNAPVGARESEAAPPAREVPVADRVLVLEARGSAWPSQTPRRLVVRRRTIEIGREPPCDWILADKHISARHARVSYEGGFYVLEVVGGTNRTAVNEAGRRLAPGDRVALARGDVIYLDAFSVGVDLIVDNTPDPSPSKPAVVGTLADLVRGAGLDPDGVALSADQLTAMGAALRCAVAGMQQLLRAQAVVTQEFRLPHSQLAAATPLRNDTGADEALKVLIARPVGESGALDAVLTAAFAEIINHELAILEGLRAGFEQLMTTIEPARLARQFGAKRRPLDFGGADAHCWREFATLMQTLAADPDRRYENLFGNSFALAYQNALERLRLARSGPKKP